MTSNQTFGTLTLTVQHKNDKCQFISTWPLRKDTCVQMNVELLAAYTGHTLCLKKHFIAFKKEKSLLISYWGGCSSSIFRFRFIGNREMKCWNKPLPNVSIIYKISPLQKLWFLIKMPQHWHLQDRVVCVRTEEVELLLLFRLDLLY